MSHHFIIQLAVFCQYFFSFHIWMRPQYNEVLMQFPGGRVPMQPQVHVTGRLSMLEPGQLMKVLKFKLRSYRSFYSRFKCCSIVVLPYWQSLNQCKLLLHFAMGIFPAVCLPEKKDQQKYTWLVDVALTAVATSSCSSWTVVLGIWILFSSFLAQVFP